MKDSFLFRGFDDDSYEKALTCFSGEVKTFDRGEAIYSPASYQRKIGFVILGECEVCRIKHDGGRVTLNSISRGGSFGISAVFSDEDFPTVIYAKRRTSVVFLTRDELLCLLNNFPEAALNIIKFQNEKITFLNKKIETFSAGTAEEKLACYLLSEAKAKDSVSLELNRKKTSEMLGIGRASLYRALDALVMDKIITYDNKKIFINDLDGLERIAK